MQPALFLVGTLADINFIHAILEAIDIEVSASDLCIIHKIRYKHVGKERTVLNTDRRVKLKGCIFSLPIERDFNILKELIKLNIEMQCRIQHHKVNLYYKAMLVEKFDDIIKFRSGDATFNSFLKVNMEFNILIQDDDSVSKPILKTADDINKISQS